MINIITNELSAPPRGTVHCTEVENKNPTRGGLSEATHCLIIWQAC